MKRIKLCRRLVGVLGAAIVACTAAIAMSNSSAPFEKGPYLQTTTATGVVIMWEAGKSGRAQVDYGPSPALGRTILVPKGEKPSAVCVTGLQPGTTYYYRVTEGDARSAVYPFRTFPTQGAFTFAAYGDSRSNPAEHAKVAAALATKSPGFVIHTGDIVYNGQLASSWDSQFFGPAEPYLSSAAVFAAAGNHEAESSFYYKYLGGHNGKPWYSFDCANAHFTMLDSCKSMKPGSEQYEWLTNDLSSTAKTWKFVVFHHAMYSSGPHGVNNDEREYLEPLFGRYGVDVALTGHDHEYERTCPIGLPGAAHKTVYIVTGGGGAPTHEPKGAPFTVVKSAEHHYCLFTIDGDTLHMAAYDTAGLKLDDWTMTKSAPKTAAPSVASTAVK